MRQLIELDADMKTPDFHEEMEIIYILSGRAGMILTGKNTLLKAEDFIVINSMEYYEIYKESGCHTISFFIPISLLQESGVGQVFCCSSLQPEQMEYLHLIRGKLAVILKNYFEFGENRKAYILSEIYGILAILGERFSQSNEKEKHGSQNNIARIREIIFYIHTHYTEQLSLEQIAAKNFISPAYLSRKFDQLLGIHFSDYIRQIRVQKAEQMLLYTNKSVTEIAEEVGYGNPNTFIIHFKDKYGVTPGNYRKNNEVHAEKKLDEREETDKMEHEKVYYVNLLKHAAIEELNEPLHKKKSETRVIHSNVHKTKEKYIQSGCNAVCFGYAKNFFKEGVKDILVQTMKEIQFPYIFINGIFDDTMAVYHENVDGMPEYQFTYLDLVLDEICAHNARPWIELGRTPVDMLSKRKMIFEGGYVQLPSRLDKWEALVKAALEHFIQRYGEDVKHWRFSVFPALYASYGLFTMEEWLTYYVCTFRVIRDLLPDTIITGGTFDVEMQKIEHGEKLIQFLEFCKVKKCMPSELSVQCFAVDYVGVPVNQLEKSIIGENGERGMEPAPPSRDRHKLKHDILYVRDILKENGVEHLPVCAVYWNSSMWEHDLGSDTCYKSCYAINTVMDTWNLLTNINYTQLIDYYDNGKDEKVSFIGESGMFTAMGIPKAVYYAYQFLAQLKEELIAQGDGYCITSTVDRSNIQILLYNYCHYNLDVHIGESLCREEQMTIDRYYYFEDNGLLNFQIYLKGLEEGKYQVEHYTIHREAGSTYDYWCKIGAPDKMTEEQALFLKNVAQPAYQYMERYVTEEEHVLLSESLDNHAAMLIMLKKI